MKKANRLVIVLFICCAMVQFNDPDPIPWVTAYGLAAAVCLAWDLNRASNAVLAGMSVLAFGMSGWMLSENAVGMDSSAMAFDWAMTAQTEPMREGMGLILIAVWMATLALLGVRSSAST